jgi:hypothetical protein
MTFPSVPAKHRPLFRHHDCRNANNYHLCSLAMVDPEESLLEINLPSAHFVCFLAWDARGVPVPTIARVVEWLLSKGAVYFVCWGSACELVHDIVDETIVELSLEDDSHEASDDHVIMTTWHSKESMEDALWFALHAAWPSEGYAATTQTLLAISIGMPTVAAQMDSALSDVNAFNARLTADEIPE